jgi:Flp pilus assembly protein TadD
MTRLVAQVCEDHGDWFGAAAQLSRMIETGRKDASLHIRRGYAYSHLEQWAKACADFAQAVALQPDNNWLWLDQAALLLLHGDLEGYQQFCERLLQRHGQTQNARAKYDLARVISLDPRSGADLRRTLQLAEQAVSAWPNGGWTLHTLGLAHYRTGHYQEALRAFHDSMVKDPSWEAHVVNWLGLALAHHRLGQEEEARRWMDKATQWIEQDAPKLPKQWSSAFPMHPHDWLAGLLLRREAEALRKGTAP